MPKLKQRMTAVLSNSFNSFQALNLLVNKNFDYTLGKKFSDELVMSKIFSRQNLILGCRS